MIRVVVFAFIGALTSLVIRLIAGRDLLVHHARNVAGWNEDEAAWTVRFFAMIREFSMMCAASCTPPTLCFTLAFY